MRRFFLASLVSGMYFLQRRSAALAWFLSIAILNWLIAGGTLRRQSMMRFIRWRRTYLGQRTNLVRFLLGWMSPPRRKLRGVFSKSGFFFAFLASAALPSGALGSAFFPCFPIARNLVA